MAKVKKTKVPPGTKPVPDPFKNPRVKFAGEKRRKAAEMIKKQRGS